jgi:hypothetical protein
LVRAHLYIFSEWKLFGKGIEVVKQETPNEHQQNGYEFGDIKIKLRLFGEQVYDQVVEEQPSQSNQQKFRELPANIGINTMECPEAVEDIVIDTSQNKTEAIGYILVPVQPFLYQKSHTEIDDKACKANQAKFQEFKKESAYTFRHAGNYCVWLLTYKLNR